METSTTNTLQIDHIIKALCNTLMHSLWQGILLALVTGAIIIFTNKARAAYRYNLLIGALTLFALGVSVTFITQLQKPAGNNIPYVGHTTGTPAYAGGIPASSTSPLSAQAAPQVIQQPGRDNITGAVINYFNAHYNIIVLIWFLIICAKSVQMAVGLHSVFHLRRSKVFAVSKDLENRLLQLAMQLHIGQTIRLLESGIAKVPMVIGHLKPVILIPIGLINSLTSDEVEAILVHELAHIRRRDYLVNLLQSFMEIIFFFNPAVLWISQLIKTERENCCDDLAIAQSRNTENYIRALLSCEEYKAAGPNYAMAFPGSKNTLLDRVKRMVGNGNHSLNVLEKTVLAVCLVVFGLGISAFTAREHIKKALKSVAAVIHHDLNAGHEQKIKVTRNDTTLKKQPGSINNTAALLNQFQHPALSTIDTGKEAGLLSLVTHKIDSLRGNNGTLNSPLALLEKLDTNNFKRFRAVGRELYRERLIIDTNHVSISLNEHELIVNGVRMPEDVHERIYRRYGNSTPDNASDSYSNAAYNSAGSGYSSSGYNSAGYDSARGSGHNYAGAWTAAGYNSPDEYANAQRDKRQRVQEETDKKLVADLLQDGLITDPNNVTFSLSDNQLLVNGKKQSEEVYRKYKAKYKPNKTGGTWNWTYSHHE